MAFSNDVSIPNGWRIQTIGDVCSRVTSGGTPSRTNANFYQDGIWPWVKTKELTDDWLYETEESITEEAVAKSSAKILPVNTVLLAMYGATVGQLGILGREMTCNQAACAMIVDEAKADYRYLFYLLLWRREKIRSLSTGAAQQNLSGQQIKLFSFVFPPLPEQRRIAHILGTLDDKIELNGQLNATLEQLARELFQSWFVDFDPVRAKISGEPADSICRRLGLTPELLALFPAALEESVIGEIPVGWVATKLGSYLSVLETGRRPKGGVSGITEGIPSIGAESIWRVGHYDYSKTKYIPKDFSEKMNSGFVESGDVMLYKDGGKPGDFKPRVSMFGEGFPFEICAINEHVFRLRSEKIGQPFLYFHIGHEKVLADLRHRGAKAAIPGINQSDVKSIRIVLPEDAVLNAYNSLVAPILKTILLNALESRNLATLRDELLPKLLSGDVRLN